MKAKARSFITALLIALLPAAAWAQEVAGSGQSPAAPESLPAAQSKGSTIALRRGTVVPLTPLETVSSATAQAGQKLQFAVTEDVKVDGTIAIPKGTPASGVVTYLRKAIFEQRDGRVGVELVSLTLPDGSSVPLREAPYTDPEAEGLCGVVLFIAALPFVFSDMAKERHPAPEAGNDETMSLCWQWWGSTTKKVRINLAFPTQTPPSHPKIDVDSICPAHSRKSPPPVRLAPPPQ
ncbi:MAG: hypothetical protein P4L26_07040 [Terracidiphilus sp.]|nr:hypothetical protein [Terracidiphilus sp.]